jgi:ADP-ribose pyrophosphatase
LDRILLPDESEIEFEAVNFHRNGVGIVAENEKDEIILVKNFRYINNFYSWEIPAGTIPPDKHHSECIIEELKEEAGCEVKKEELIYLGNYYASIGSSNQAFHCYYAKKVIQVTDDLDANEILEAKWFAKEEIKKMIVDGTIKDGFSLCLLMRCLFLPN